MAGPDAIGDAATTPGTASKAVITCCQLSIERILRGAVCTSAMLASPASICTRAAGSTGLATMCACAPSVRRMVFDCRPVTSAEMNTTTATPTITPPTINADWARPSRRKRSAICSSKRIMVPNFGPVAVLTAALHRQFDVAGRVGATGATPHPLACTNAVVQYDEVARLQSIENFGALQRAHAHHYRALLGRAMVAFGW